MVVALMIPATSWAAAAYSSTLTPKACTIDYCSGGGVAVADVQNGYTMHVDDTGAGYVMEKAKTIYEGIGSADLWPTGQAAATGAARVYTITWGGPTAAAGDAILIYDATSATGTPKFDVATGTAADTVHIVIPGGAIFSTGVFVKLDDAGSVGSVLTLTYDQ